MKHSILILPEFMGCSKAMIRGKIITLNSHRHKNKRIKVNKIKFPTQNEKNNIKQENLKEIIKIKE